jgi:hypothetical protein
MENAQTSPRAAWSLAEISGLTGLSIGYLRNEQRSGRLPVKRFGRRVVKRFGRRVVVLDKDLQLYLSNGSEGEHGKGLHDTA